MSINNLIKEARGLYDNNPLEYCFYNVDFPNKKTNITINNDALYIIDQENNLLAYNYYQSYIPLKGLYRTMMINDKIYHKIIKKVSEYEYKDELFFKAFIDNKENDEKYSNIEYERTQDNKLIIKGPYEVNAKLLSSQKVRYTLWHLLTLVPRTTINTYNDFQKKLQEIMITKDKPSLLLHSCCGPCSSYVLKYLHDYFKITVFFENSNIFPEKEFNKRLETQKKIIEALGFDDISLIVSPYNHSYYLEKIYNYQNSPEHSYRCHICYKMRMEKCSQYAQKNDFDYFTTTISISPHKNAIWVNEIGIELEKKYDVKFLYSNFKLNNGYLESIKLSKKYDLYRQDYCGCEMSLRANESKNGE